jgi:hypothetical protein
VTDTWSGLAENFVQRGIGGRGCSAVPEGADGDRGPLFDDGADLAGGGEGEDFGGHGWSFGADCC